MRNAPRDGRRGSRAPRGGGSWTEAVERALRVGLLAVVVFDLVGGLAVSVPEMEAGRVSPLALVAVLIGQLALLVAVGSRRVTVLLSAIATLATGLGMLLAQPGPFGLDAAWWPRAFLVSVLAYLVIVHPRRGWVGAGVLILVHLGHHALAWRTAPPVGPLSPLASIAAEAGGLTSRALAAYLIARLCRDIAHVADASVRRERGIRENAAASRSRTHQVREADRFVHDEVLHRLRLLAMDREAVPQTQALTAARELNGLLRAPSPATAAGVTGLLARLQDVARAAPITVDVAGPPSLDVPAEVTTALVSATAEALRNVQRHAGVSLATVTARGHEGAVEVAVSDAGVGFDPALVTPGRRGVLSSIEQRMRDIGGVGSVLSQPGQGTTVTLRWPATPAEELGDAEVARTMGQILPALSTAITPVLLLPAWFALFLAQSTKAPGPIIAASLAVVLIGLLAIRRGLRRGLSGLDSLVVTVVAWGATVVNLLVLPDPPLPVLLWIPANAALLGTILSLFRPTAEGLVCSVGLTVIAGSILLRAPQGTLGLYVPLLLTPLVIAGAGLIFRYAVDRVHADITRAEEAHRAALAAVRADSAFRAQLSARLGHRRVALSAFLDGLLADPSALGSESTRRTADRIEQGLRDDLVLEANPGLRTALGQLRDAGTHVVLRTPGGLPLHLERRTIDALRSLQSAATAVTLTALPLGPRWRVTVVATVPDPDFQAGRLRAAAWQVAVNGHEVHAVLIQAPPPDVA